MSALFDEALRFTLAAEGSGFVDNPQDPGGATYRGITLRLYRSWACRPYANAAELQALSDGEVQAIYGACFWNPVRGDQLPPGLGLTAFDIAVNEGVREGALALQRALGIVADGSIGPETVAAATRADVTALLHAIAVDQQSYYRSLTTFSVFGQGWLNRVSARLDASLKAVTAEPSFMVPGLPGWQARALRLSQVASGQASPGQASSGQASSGQASTGQLPSGQAASGTTADALNAAELTRLGSGDTP